MDIVDEAAWLTETERAEGIRRVQATLATDGEPACIGCGEDIEPARRAALPSARRCIVCQGRVEARDRTRPPAVDSLGLALMIQGAGR